MSALRHSPIRRLVCSLVLLALSPLAWCALDNKPNQAHQGDDPDELPILKIESALEHPHPKPDHPAAGGNQDDGPAYFVNHFVFASVGPWSQKLPTAQSLIDTPVNLQAVANGWVAPREGEAGRKISLKDLASLPNPWFYQSALLAIDTAIVKRINKAGVLGIYVGTSTHDVDPDTGKDLRKGNGTLHLQIRIGHITEMRTVRKYGPLADRINNPKDVAILENAPVAPHKAGQKPMRSNLILRDELDKYVARLNSKPSPRIDIAMSASKEEGGIAIDFLIDDHPKAQKPQDPSDPKTHSP